VAAALGVDSGAEAVVVLWCVVVDFFDTVFKGLKDLETNEPELTLSTLAAGSLF